MRTYNFLFTCFLLALTTHLFAQEAPQPHFTENKGQWDERIQYSLQTNAGMVWFENQQFTFALYDKPKDKHDKEVGDNSPQIIKSHVYHSHFLGANPHHSIISQEKYADYANYYLGNDQRKWKDHVYSYAAITYKDLYTGIDVQVYSGNGNLKYDYLLSPAALQNGGIAQIKVAFEGIDKENIRLNAQGDLVFTTNVGEVKELKPYAYQLVKGSKKQIPCNYLWENGILSFDLDETQIDLSQPLVIDPTVIFSTYTASTQDNWGFTATYDNAGNAYGGGVIYSGFTFFQYQIGSIGYPTVGAYQTSYNGGCFDATITKFNPTGNALIFSTYLGGQHADQPHSLVADLNGNLFVFGRTSSTNFPTSANAYDPTDDGDIDLFITKFGPTGGFLASTYIGGSGEDGVNGDTIEGVAGAPSLLEFNYGDDARGEIFADDLGNVYVASCTKSFDFPTANAYQGAFNGGLSDGVVFKMNNTLTALTFSTYLGGSGDDAAYSVNVDNAYNVYTSGGTNSGNFPTSVTALHTTFQGGIADGFVTKLNPAGNAMLASTYIGTSSYDQNFFIQLENNVTPYIYGQSNGAYPVVGAVYSNAGANQYITKLDTDLSTIALSTTFGTNAISPNISPTAFLVDICGGVYVAGWGGTLGGYNTNCTTTFGMPTAGNPYQGSTDGSDFYLMVLTPNMAGLQYATFFGGNGSQEHVDGGTSRFDPNGVVYHAVCAGCGGNSLFPTFPNLASGGTLPWGPNNLSPNCNLAVFKIDFDFQIVNAGFTPTQNNIPTYAGCADLTLVMQNGSTTAAGTTYTWIFGDSTANSNVYQPTHTYTTADTFYVMLIVNSNSCAGSDTAYSTIIVGVGPSTDFILPPLVCEGVPVTLTYTGDPAVTFTWNFAGAIVLSGTGAGPYSLSWPVAGNYCPSVSITDSYGCNSDTATHCITVIGVPTSDFTLPDTVCQSNATVAAYTGNANAGAFYDWNFGGGIATPGGNVQGPHLIYWNSPGSHIVSLTVSANGCIGLPTSDTVYLEPGPIAAFTMTDSICEGGTAIVSIIGQPYPGAIYYWDFGTAAGGGAGTGPFNLTWVGNGIRTVKLYIESQNGCPSDTFVQDILINPIPTSPFTATDTLCISANATVTYTGSAGANASYTWNFGGATIVSGSGQGAYTLSFINSIDYYISLIVTERGCTSLPSYDTVTVSAAPISAFFMPDTACIGATISINYTGASVPNQTYNWNFGLANVISGNGQGPYTASWTVPNLQTVTLTTSTPYCPNAFSSHSITILQGPPANILASPVAICFDDTTQIISSNNSANYTYLWNFAGGYASPGAGEGPHNVNWLFGGDKYVTLTLYENGCPGIPDTTLVQVYEPPTAEFAYPNFVCILDTNQVVFTGNASANGIYNWNFGDAVVVSGTGQGPYVLSWTTPGIKTICVSVAQAACPASDITCHTFTVIDKPIASIAPLPNVCFPDSTISAIYNGSPNIDNYYWGFPGGFPAFVFNTPNPTGIHYNTAGHYYVWCYVVRDGCASDTVWTEFDVVPKPNANFTYSGSLCMGSCINFDYTGVAISNQQAYQWNFSPTSAPVYSTLENVTCVQFNLPVPTPVTLIVDYLGCKDTTTQIIPIHPLPQVNAGIDTSFCAGTGPITLDATVVGGTTPYYYTWTSIPVGMGGISDPYVEDASVNPTGPTQYIFYVTDGTGCVSNVDTAFVWVRPNPIAYAGPDQKICDFPGAFGVFLQGGVAPTNQAPGGYSYSWFPDSGMIAGQDTLAHPYVHPFTTTIYTLIVTSANGCTSSPLDTMSTVTVDVSPMPIVNAGPTLEMCQGDTVQFLASAAGGGTYTYTWTPNNAGAGVFDYTIPTSLANPDFTHTYTLVVNGNGCQGSDTTTIVVHTLPTAAIHPPVANFCQGEGILLTGYANGDPFGTIYSYSWSPVIGLTTPDSAATWASPLTTTQYSLFVSSTHCIGFTDEMTIYVKSTPIANVANNDTIICSGSSVQLSGSFSFNLTPFASPILFNWQPANSLNDNTIANPIATPTQTTVYTLQTSYAGDCITEDEVTIVVNPMPIATATSDMSVICGGNSTVLHANGGSPAAAYSWTPALSLNNSSLQNPTATPVSSTVYSVWVKDATCSDSASVYVQVNPQPIADYVATNMQGCAPLTVAFGDASTNPLLYIWNFGDGSPVENSPTVFHTYTQAGTYPVSYTIFGQGGCADTDANGVVVVSDATFANFTSVPPIDSVMYLPNSTVTFTDMSHNALSWFWIFGDGQTSSEENPAHFYGEKGEYPVTLIVTNIHGCTDTLTRYPYIVLAPDLFIPNVFSPNGDGFYDQWNVLYSGKEELSVSIFDRWGVEYFTTTSAEKSWNGTTTNGKEASDGVYYYSIMVGKKNYKGNLTLLR